MCVCVYTTISRSIEESNYRTNHRNKTTLESEKNHGLFLYCVSCSSLPNSKTLFQFSVRERERERKKMAEMISTIS